MPNLIDFYKGIFLHVIPAYIPTLSIKRLLGLTLSSLYPAISIERDSREKKKKSWKQGWKFLCSAFIFYDNGGKQRYLI